MNPRELDRERFLLSRTSCRSDLGSSDSSATASPEGTSSPGVASSSLYPNVIGCSSVSIKRNVRNVLEMMGELSAMVGIGGGKSSLDVRLDTFPFFSAKPDSPSSSSAVTKLSVSLVNPSTSNVEVTGGASDRGGSSAAKRTARRSAEMPRAAELRREDPPSP